MEFYQALIFFSVLFFGLFFSRKWLYAIVIFWAVWTLTMVLTPSLMVIQFVNVGVSTWLALAVGDWREKRKIDADLGTKFDRGTYGKVFLITTESFSTGAADFQRILSRYNIPVEKVLRMSRKDCDYAIARIVDSLESKIGQGDIVCIVRGGGNSTEPQFDVFRSKVSCKAILQLREKGAISVLGVGHALDVFELDTFVDYAAITPTEAAFFVVKLKGTDSNAQHSPT